MRCEYDVTWERFHAWWRQVHAGMVWRLLAGLWLLLAVLCVFLTFGSSFSLIYGFLALFCFYRGCLRRRILERRQYRLLADRCGGENWRRVLAFGEDRLTVQEGPFSTVYPYAELREIREKGDTITLVFRKGDLIPFMAGDLTAGSWPACRELLEAHRGSAAQQQRRQGCPSADGKEPNGPQN